MPESCCSTHCCCSDSQDSSGAPAIAARSRHFPQLGVLLSLQCSGMGFCRSTSLLPHLRSWGGCFCFLFLVSQHLLQIPSASGSRVFLFGFLLKAMSAGRTILFVRCFTVTYIDIVTYPCLRAYPVNIYLHIQISVHTQTSISLSIIRMYIYTPYTTPPHN